MSKLNLNLKKYDHVHEEIKSQHYLYSSQLNLPNNHPGWLYTQTWLQNRIKILEKFIKMPGGNYLWKKLSKLTHKQVSNLFLDVIFPACENNHSLIYNKSISANIDSLNYCIKAVNTLTKELAKLKMSNCMVMTSKNEVVYTRPLDEHINIPDIYYGSNNQTTPLNSILQNLKKTLGWSIKELKKENKKYGKGINQREYDLIEKTTSFNQENFGSPLDEFTAHICNTLYETKHTSDDIKSRRTTSQSRRNS